ncbi:MAG TPA: autotransporter-associated beta strand repeat-containing protein [Verrucomicrobiae bacterium]|jgi:autotransporter-associated beta strand protein|nr:autotransporter-associated beta strand repeat-containing protein [Verrucomicrobiae bacterium]
MKTPAIFAKKNLRLLALLTMACGIISAQAQVTATYTPDSWTNDPYSPNTAWGITAPNTDSPTYTNNGVNYNNNLYGYSPIGATITLTYPGDTIIMTAVVTTSGDVASANLQFRFGPVYRGSSPNDEDWGGALIADPNTGGQSGLYVESIPNSSVFSTAGSATTHGSGTSTYVGGSQGGPLAYTVSVTYLNPTSTLISWTVQGLAGNAYVYTGRYTNTTAATQGGFNYDTVGFLKGGSVFTGNSTANAITFSNVTVTVGNFGDGAWTNLTGGDWSTTNNWVNGIPANGSGFIGTFGPLALTSDTTVSLDSSRNLGALNFGVTGGSPYNWILNSAGGGALSLNNNGLAAAPNIAVADNEAILDLSVNSTNGLSQTGAGLLVLGGDNSISGPLDLYGGELSFSSLANLPLSASGISSITFSNGGLQWASGNTLDISSVGIPISFAGNATFDTGGNNVTFADSFGDGGAGGFTKAGSGALTLNGSVVYAGATLVSNGVLVVGSSGSIPGTTNLVVLSNATLNVSALSGGLTLSSSGGLSGAGTVDGNISDAPGATIGAGYAATGSAGTLTINGNLSLNGAGNLNFGLANLTTEGEGTNDLIAVSGNLDVSGPTALNVNLINGAPGLGTYTLFTYGTLSGSAANLTPPLGFTVTNNTSAKTIGLVVTHVPQSLVWKGDGSANVWDTDNTPNWLDDGSPSDFFAGDSVTFDNTGSDNPYINIEAAVSPASVTVNASQDYDFAGTGSIATGSLTKSGSGTLILENNNTYNGPTVINGGTLQIGGPVEGGVDGSLGAGHVTNNSALVFDLAGTYTLSANIPGTGSISNIGAGATTLSGNVGGGTVTMAGTGALVLSGSNTYTGQTIVSSGSLQIQNSNALGSGTATVAVSNGAQLYITANINLAANPISLQGTGNNANGALEKGGNGVSYAGNPIILTGDTLLEVDGGSTLYLTNAAGITAPGTNLFLGAASGGTGYITGPVNLGPAALTSEGAGTWTIAPTNTFTGGAALEGGTLEISSSNALGAVAANPNFVTFTGGTLGALSNITFADGVRGFAFSGTGGFNVASGATLAISDPITGSGTLTKSGPGTLVLSGTNTFSGALDVDSDSNANNDGALVITSSNAIADVASPIAIQNTLGGASTFELAGTNANILVTQNFTINGRSPFVPAILNAAGTNTLAGNLTFGGGGPQYIIESDSGLLTLGTSTNSVTFTTADPQTLTLQGNGAVFAAGGIDDVTNTISIEKEGNGSLTLGGVNTYTGSTTVTGGALIVDGTIGAGAVTVSGGSLGGAGTIGGTVNVGAAGTFSPGAPLGTLTINNALTLAGNTVVTVNKTSGVNSQVAGLTSVAYGGALTVSNISGALASGDSFHVFPAISAAGNFTSISPAPGAGLAWQFNPATGVLSIVGGALPTTPTNITYSVSGGNLTLNWPQSYTGWILQAQTNTAGLGTNWVDVSGSSGTNSVVIPIDQANPAVFFRLEN